MNTITIIALILIFIGSVGGILLVFGQLKTSTKNKNDIISITKKENTELKNKLENLKKEREKLDKTLAARDEKIQVQNSKIQKLQNKLILKSNETLKWVLGDGILMLELVKVEKNRHLLLLVNNSDYPIYDVTIEISDFDKIVKCKHFLNENNEVTISKKCHDENSRIYNLNSNIIPNTKTPIEMKFDFTTQTKHFMIKIHTRNSSTTRNCVFRLDENNSKWIESYKIYTMKKNKILVIDENDPIGLNKNYWKDHFFGEREIFLSTDY